MANDNSTPNSGNPTPPDGSTRDRIAMIVLITSIGGLILLAGVIISMGCDSAKDIFNALLPVFGTWVGTLLAFYFTKDNFEAATRSVTAMAGKVSGATERLQQVAAKDKMRQLKDIGTYALKKGAEDQCVLSQLLDKCKYERIPMVDSNVVIYLVYKATVHQFLTDVALKKVTVANKDAATVTLKDALDAVPGLHETFEKSFGFIPVSATLADAQREMERVSKDTACNDIFVTPGGKPDEAIVGWITDNTIAENLKV